jgi:hypothetical protein
MNSMRIAVEKLRMITMRKTCQKNILVNKKRNLLRRMLRMMKGKKNKRIKRKKSRPQRKQLRATATTWSRCVQVGRPQSEEH